MTRDGKVKGMARDACGSTDRDLMEQLLQSEEVGRLGLTCDDQPYVIAINYTYTDRQILIHCALEGRKLDMIARNARVCFEVSRQEGPAVPHGGNRCDMPFESVLCFGTARVINDLEERIEVLNRFQTRYDTPEKTREQIGPERAAKCGAIVIDVHRMTGRKHPGNHRYEWECADDA